MIIFIFETFEEEMNKFKKIFNKTCKVNYTENTIQEWLKDDYNKIYRAKCPGCIISIRTQSIIPNEWLNSNNLKGILSRSTGYDHIPKHNNILRGYLPCYCSSAVAEHATMLWMSLLKKLPQQINQWKTFNRNNLTCKEFGKNKKMLVVGVGNIGYKVIKIAKSLNIEVYGLDIIKKYEDVNYIDKDNLIKTIKNIDIVICCMNLTSDNHNYFNYELLSNIKKQALFINVSRGELVVCNDLLQLLKEGTLGGVGMDVYPNENTLGDKLRSTNNWFTDNKEEIAILEMSKLTNVIFTPHNAFNTMEGLEQKVKDTVIQINHFYETGSFKWVV